MRAQVTSAACGLQVEKMRTLVGRLIEATVEYVSLRHVATFQRWTRLSCAAVAGWFVLSGARMACEPHLLSSSSGYSGSYARPICW